MVGGLLKRFWVKVMDRVGGQFVSGMADTSSDAPSAGYTPKRKLYEQMKQASEEAAHGHDHDHR
jgi:hypothetical protein